MNINANYAIINLEIWISRESHDIWQIDGNWWTVNVQEIRYQAWINHDHESRDCMWPNSLAQVKWRLVFAKIEEPV